MANGLYGFGKSIERAGTKVEAAIHDYGNVFSRLTGELQGIGSAAMNGDIVGMDYGQVENIRDSIRNYVTNIQTELKELNASAETSKAFKGEIQGAVQGYVQAVTQAAHNYVSHLLEFSDKMEWAKQQYQAHDTELKQQVDSQSSELSSSVDEYTEQM